MYASLPYLLKIVLAASKASIAKRGHRIEPPTLEARVKIDTESYGTVNPQNKNQIGAMS